MNIAVIPARGGSKRIPRKNIKFFFEKPMMAWSIEAALKANCFDRIIVSTDDEEIAAVARQYGAEVPFLRPADLANDYAGTIPVIQHAVDWLVCDGVLPNAVCCLYATAPFVQPEDLVSAFSHLTSSGCDYVFSVASFPAPIQRALRVTNEQRIEMFYPEHRETRSQDLEPAYHDAAQFYWGTRDAWQQAKPIFDSGSMPFVLPAHRVQDIDTLDDWLRAELLFKAMSLA